MADAGAAVGVISLALQVFQGLSRYYSDFRSFDESIEYVVHRIERLSGILSALESPVRRLEIDNDAISEQVRLAITSVEKGIDKLEQIHRNCSQASAFMPNTQMSRRQMIKDRVLYPFRKDTLRDIGKCLETLQANLDTILQALQLDTIIRFDEKADSRTHLLTGQIDRVESRQVYQCELLETVQETSKANAELMSSQVQEGIENLSLQIQALQSQISVQMKPIVHSLQMQRFPPPSAISEGMKSQYDLEQLIRRLILKKMQCSCPVNSNPSLYHIPRRRFGLYYGQSRIHRQCCPYYASGGATENFGAYVTSFGRGMSRVRRLGLVCRWGAGGFSIGSALQCQTFIAWGHPSLDFMSDYNLGVIAVEAGGEPLVLDYIKRQMDTMFRKGCANPWGITGTGETYLALACKIVADQLIYTSHSLESRRDFLEYFVRVGVPLNSLSNPNRSDSLIIHFFRDEGRDDGDGWKVLYSFLAGLGLEWCMPTPGFLWPYAPFMIGWIPLLKQAISYGSIADAYCGNPIEIAVLTESALALHDAIRTEKLTPTRNYDMAVPLIMAASWPEGLRLLLQEFDYNREPYSVALFNAFWCKNIQSVDLLLEEGFQMSLDMWTRGLPYWDIETARLAIKRISDDSSKSFSRAFNTDYFYHHRHLSEDVASYLFECGFQDVDLELRDPQGTTTPITPLWLQSFYLLDIYSAHPLNTLRVIHWLGNKGARFDYLHPEARTTPAHILAAVLRRGWQRDWPKPGFQAFMQDPDLVRLYRKVLTLNFHDECNCACSQEGCLPIASAVKLGVWRDWVWQDPGNFSKQLTSSLIFQLLGNGPISSELATAALRVLTFEKLGINHTCYDVALYRICISNNDAPLRIPDEEIHELQDEYRDLIDQLEELMDKFSDQLSHHEGTFQNFIDSYWTRQMDEVLAEMETITPEHIGDIENIGVILEDRSKM